MEEEFLPKLKGRKAIKLYKEMMLNDPVVGAVLFAIKQAIRSVEWNVRAASGAEQDKKTAVFIKQCMHDMSLSWPDFIDEVLTMLPFAVFTLHLEEIWAIDVRSTR